MKTKDFIIKANALISSGKYEAIEVPALEDLKLLSISSVGKNSNFNETIPYSTVPTEIIQIQKLNGPTIWMSMPRFMKFCMSHGFEVPDLSQCFRKPSNVKCKKWNYNMPLTSQYNVGYAICR